MRNETFVVVKLFDHEGKLVDYDVVSETSNYCCLHGIDKEGNHQQFDSCEAYHASQWADGHGFRVEFEDKELDFIIERY